jgi:hypothetical protein
MTTKEMITFLSAKSNEDRPVLLSLLNEVVNFVNSKNTQQSIYYDSANGGLPPFLVTTNNIYRYTFPDGTYAGANVLKTVAVVSLTYMGTQNVRVVQSERQQSYYINNQEAKEIPITQLDANESSPAELTFSNINPGTSTGVFYHVFVKKPVVITSDTIQIPIPSKHHLRIRQACLMLLRDEKYGDLSAWEYIEQKIIPQIWFDQNNSNTRFLTTRSPMKDREYTGI